MPKPEVNGPTSNLANEGAGYLREEDSLGAVGEFGDVSSLEKDLAFNPGRKHLTRAEADRLREILQRFNHEIEDLRRTGLKPAVDGHIDSMIAAGMYQETSPGTPVRPSSRGNGIGFRSDGVKSYAVEFNPRRVPEIAAALSTMDDLRELYKVEIEQFFASVPSERCPFGPRRPVYAPFTDLVGCSRSPCGPCRSR